MPRNARSLPLIFIAVSAVLGAVLFRDELSFEALATHHDRLSALRDSHFGWAALGFVGAYVAIVALSLPGATMASLTGGFLFGLFPGVLFNVAGATLGASLLFLAARMGLGERLAARMEADPGVLGRLKHGLDDNQWSVLFMLRLVPVVPFFVANLLPALFDVPLHRYVITTALGIIPAGLVFTSVGAGLGEVIAAGAAPDLSVLFSARVLGPLLGLAALAALPMLLRAYRGATT